MRWDFNFHVQAGLWIYADDPSLSDPASGTALDRARALFVAQAESIWEGGGEGLVMIRFEMHLTTLMLLHHIMTGSNPSLTCTLPAATL